MGIEKPHKRLLAWQKSMELVVLIYEMTRMNEVSTQLEIAYRISYLDLAAYDKAQNLVDECLALTYGLRKKVGGEH